MSAGVGGESGNGSYIFYTSGSGQFIHRFVMDKSDTPAIARKAAALPSNYDFIVGIKQLPVSKGPLYMLTLSTLFTAPGNETSQMSKLMDVKLDLSKEAVVAVSALDTADSIWAVDTDTAGNFNLHQFSLSTQSVSTLAIAGMNVAKDGNVQALQFVDLDTPETSYLVAVTSGGKLARIELSGNASFPFTSLGNYSALTRFSAIELGSELYFTSPTTLYSAYLDLPDSGAFKILSN